MLMAVLENKQQGLRFQQSILLVERTICLLFCDQCLFWSDKTQNGQGSLPCYDLMCIQIAERIIRITVQSFKLAT